MPTACAHVPISPNKGESTIIIASINARILLWLKKWTAILAPNKKREKFHKIFLQLNIKSKGKKAVNPY
jgi:hypothetical protein